MPGSQQRGKGKRHTPLRSDAHFIQAKRSAELQVGAVTDEREQWGKRKQDQRDRWAFGLLDRSRLTPLCHRDGKKLEKKTKADAKNLQWVQEHRERR